MCGIAGFVGQGSEEVLGRMIRALAHRGPDGSGIWTEEGVGLAHTRLAIIDLSPSANQPMESASGKHIIIFNGEIYNFLELRRELEGEGYRFKTRSDTEVILAAYTLWGVKCFARLNGMFAIALYDKEKKELLLARDPLGKKPLYVTLQKGVCVFGSELKALLSHPAVPRIIDMRALSHYLAREYVPTPLSIFEGVRKVMPGSVTRFSAGRLIEEFFWRPLPDTGQDISETEALEEFDALLSSSVSKRLISDVPLGVFLSGGIDSSSVAYYAAQNSSQKIKTFSVGFSEKTFDESPQAALVAKHLDTEHHATTLSGKDALALVSRIPQVFDEPVADASVLPTLLLSHFTREKVTVALGGDGADELLLGYPTFRAEHFASLYGVLPLPIRHAARLLAGTLPTSNTYFSFDFKVKKFLNDFNSDDGVRHMQWLGSFREDELQTLLLPQHREVSVGITNDLISQWAAEYSSRDTLNELSHLYARTYCMDDVLVKVDRASMHYGLEVRTPFLDKELVDFLFSLPSSYKYKNGVSKYLLKKLMRGKLPESILGRSKQGFAAPTAAWLRGPLRVLMTDMLSSGRLQGQGIFNPEEVEKLMTQHLRGSHDHRKKLWTLLTFQLWYDAWAK